jgi:hypothetical protein
MDPGGTSPAAVGTLMPRRFPSPWSIEEGSACFIVRDGGQALAYV